MRHLPWLLFLAGCAPAPAPGPETFPPERQTPFFERGLVLAPSALPCVPVTTGVPQTDCNHHGSSIVELPDGTIAISWFHGEFEKSLDTRIVLSRLAPGSTEWTAPEVLFDDPARSEGNSAWWVREDGVVFVFFVSIEGNGWAQARMRFIKSDDGGKTFGAPVTLDEGDCWMLRNKPVRLAGGDVLLPGYYECLGVPVFVRSRDNFATWSLEQRWGEGSWLLDHVSQIQPALAVGAEGRVTALTRDGSQHRRVGRMTADAQARTWSVTSPTVLPNAGTGVDQTQLLDGHTVVLFNNSPDARFPLAAALSVDDTESFTAVRHLDDVCDPLGCAYSYPSVTQSRRDGTLWVSYTYDRRTIGWVHFNEAWLKEGGNVASVRCLGADVCRGGTCAGPCGAAGACGAGQTCREGACRSSCSSSADCPKNHACADGVCATDGVWACAP
jgi:predicted neuraminidase